jgi:hypothetical protein
MNTNKLTRCATGILAVITVAVLVWQQRCLTQSRQQTERFRSETAQLPAMRAELARLKPVEADQAELAGLRQKQNAVQLELIKLRGQAAGALRAEAEAARIRTELERQAAQGSDGTKQFTAAMAETMKDSLGEHFQRRLTRMQERLNLSPEQAQAIHEILTRQANGFAEAMKGIYSGKLDRQKINELRGGGGKPEDQIRALLSPEQQTAYAVFKDEETATSARLAANTELIQMQSSLDLTPEQQDKTFAILYDQTLQQYKGEAAGSAPVNPAEMVQAINDRKRQALEGVLTLAQLDVYRQQQERQIKFLKGLVQKSEPPAVPR